MNFLRTLIGDLSEYFEIFKGERSFKVINVHQSIQDSYKAVTNSGSVIEIFCKELTYRVSYSKWWAMDKDVVMYHVYCAYSDDTNQALKDRLKEDFVIAQLLHPFSHRVSQKKAVIDSYVDLILSKF